MFLNQIFQLTWRIDDSQFARVSTTCFTWLIGSMNECYIDINQDFTKVKKPLTLSWYLDLYMQQFPAPCTTWTIDKYLYLILYINIIIYTNEK